MILNINNKRGWDTQMVLVGGGDATVEEHRLEEGVYSTSYKTYSLAEVKIILDKIRKKEILAGLPKRNLSPVTRYIMEELIDQYFKNYAPKGAILEMIIIKDSKRYGV